MIKAGRLIKKFSDPALTLADAHGLSIMSERRIADLLVDGPPHAAHRRGTGHLTPAGEGQPHLRVETKSEVLDTL